MPRLNTRKIAKRLGAKRKGKVSAKGGFPGAESLAHEIAAIRRGRPIPEHDDHWRGKHGNGIIPMPDGYRIYNACNEPCDAAAGPCSCGAWHARSDWTWRASQPWYSKKEKNLFKKLVAHIDATEDKGT